MQLQLCKSLLGDVESTRHSVRQNDNDYYEQAIQVVSIITKLKTIPRKLMSLAVATMV